MLEYNDFAGKFGMWADDFRPFIESQEMYDIMQRIKGDAAKQGVVPSSDDTFRAFAGTPSSHLKVVWYLMDPYPRRYKDRTNQATGIAMDCSHSPDGKLQPSLDFFYDKIETHVGEKIDRNVSLEYLLYQGVMMLNTDLTCKLNRTGSHLGVWEPFQKYFLTEVLKKKTGLIFVLSGESSERMRKYINPLGNTIIRTEHPMAAGHKHIAWNDNGALRMIDKITMENGERIYWNRADWERASEPPF